MAALGQEFAGVWGHNQKNVHAAYCDNMVMLNGVIWDSDNFHKCSWVWGLLRWSLRKMRFFFFLSFLCAIYVIEIVTKSWQIMQICKLQQVISVSISLEVTVIKLMHLQIFKRCQLKRIKWKIAHCHQFEELYPKTQFPSAVNKRCHFHHSKRTNQYQVHT